MPDIYLNELSLFPGLPSTTGVHADFGNTEFSKTEVFY